MTAHVWYGLLLFLFCSCSGVVDCASNFLTVNPSDRKTLQSRWKSHYFPAFSPLVECQVRSALFWGFRCFQFRDGITSPTMSLGTSCLLQSQYCQGHLNIHLDLCSLGEYFSSEIANQWPTGWLYVHAFWLILCFFLFLLSWSYPIIEGLYKNLNF